jgi:transmembrane sensor
VALGCFAALAVGAYFYFGPIWSGSLYTTPIGGIETVPLADGSQVTLNTDTSLRVTLTPKERRIQLERGEAFFQVAKDKKRPFIVSVADKRVIAVGTQFAVRRDDEEIRVIVTEGRVNLSQAGQFPSPIDMGAPSTARVHDGQPGSLPTDTLTDAVATPPTYLSAGEIARTSKMEVLVSTAAASDAEKLLSWRSGYLRFDNTTLAEAVAEFNRYNTRKIAIDDPAIAAIRVGGNFRSTNTDGFLWLLQSGFPIVVDRSDDKIVLKAR